MAHQPLLNSDAAKIAQEDPLGLRPTPGLYTAAPDVSERLMFDGIVPDAAKLLDVASLGKSLTIESDRQGEFTHAVAKRHLELPEIVVADSHLDRRLRKTHVSYLLREALRGEFHPEQVMIITCVCNEKIGDNPAGTEYRDNGKHTAWMRLYMPPEWPCRVRFLRYRASKTADMRNLYASTDRGLVRTGGNVIVSIVAGTPGYEGLRDRLITSLASGLAFWLEVPTGRHGPNTPVEEYKVQYDPSEIAFLMLRDKFDICQKVKEYFVMGPHNAETRRIQITAVMAAPFETFSVLPSKSHEFWYAVRDGTGLMTTGDPRLKLHKLLHNMTVVKSSGSVRGSGGGSGGARIAGKRGGGVEDIYAWCINCWNAWRKGTELNYIAGSKGIARPKAR